MEMIMRTIAQGQPHPSNNCFIT